ncbi:MAG: response regulator transcription factor [Chitinophagaceae bacterium]|jgi:DNA-binding NarL/FixJ family response regulator|nr:response regulator transcription factor [Chitinophagaceae bacterium]
MNTIVNLLIVDDHPLVVEGLRTMLMHLPHIQLQATAANAFEAMEALRQHQIDVALIDINLPDISGIELTARIRKEYPTVNMLALSTFTERSYIAQMMQSGAIGYLVKSAGTDEIEQGIMNAMKGEPFMSASLNLSGRLLQELPLVPLLTRREKEVLKLIADGMTNQQIAEKLYLSLHTVDSHRKNLLAKFNLSNTASLIKTAAKMNLI